MKNMFYNTVRIILKFFFYLLYRPKVVGKKNLIRTGPFVLAGNHTKWLDPIMLIATVPRPIHFLAKKELFKGVIGFFVKQMGCIPVNRKVHDKNVLKSAYECLEKGNIIGIFPEGTINRGNDLLLPFKFGAVKMSKECKCKIVPFVITGEYKLFKKSITIEFLPSYYGDEDLDKSNEILRNKIGKKLEEYKNECN